MLKMFSAHPSMRGWLIGAATMVTAALFGHERLATAVAAQAAAPEPVIVDAHAAIEEHVPIPASQLASGSPVFSAGSRIFYTSENGQMRAGVWESGRGKLKLDVPVDEFALVVEGEAVVRNADGKSWTFKAGDALVLPRGFKGEVEMSGSFRKLFVSVLPVAPGEGH